MVRLYHNYCMGNEWVTTLYPDESGCWGVFRCQEGNISCG